MKNLDLNTLHQQPTMSLTLRDKNRTVLHLKLATVATIERIQNVLSDVQEMKVKDVKSVMKCINTLYDLTADLLSCNREGITLTADSLKTKYKIDTDDMMVIFNAYLEFADEVKSAKN
ncbi:MAG: hypothetical protein K2I93_02720 [Oscillospiraceae bacterium]|nr:hypothetical protein [Oscillospiraceae bacterium]